MAHRFPTVATQPLQPRWQAATWKPFCAKRYIATLPTPPSAPVTRIGLLLLKPLSWCFLKCCLKGNNKVDFLRNTMRYVCMYISIYTQMIVNNNFWLHHELILRVNIPGGMAGKRTLKNLANHNHLISERKQHIGPGKMMFDRHLVHRFVQTWGDVHWGSQSSLSIVLESLFSEGQYNKHSCKPSGQRIFKRAV